MCPPTTTWICDACGGVIREASQGWVEWIVLRDPVPTGMMNRSIRIVHATQGCQYDGNRQHLLPGEGIGDASLTQFVGPDGLMDLLEKLLNAEFPAADLIEIVKRTHIPGYEHARGPLQSALAENRIEVNDTPGFSPRRIFNGFDRTFGPRGPPG